MRPTRRLLVAGLVLLALSAWPIFLMARESMVMHSVDRRYEVTPLQGPRQVEYHGHTIRLSDEFRAKGRKPEDREIGVVKITIDGRDYTHPTPVEIRPTEWDANRYWMEVMLVRFLDRETGQEAMVVLQRIPSIVAWDSDYDLNALQCRALYVSRDGSVREEIFRFKDRAHPPSRAWLAYWVSPEPLGITTQVMQYWPTIFYPFLYPFFSGILGVILTTAALISQRLGERDGRAGVFMAG